MLILHSALNHALLDPCSINKFIRFALKAGFPLSLVRDKYCQVTTVSCAKKDIVLPENPRNPECYKYTYNVYNTCARFTRSSPISSRRVTRFNDFHRSSCQPTLCTSCQIRISTVRLTSDVYNPDFFFSTHPKRSTTRLCQLDYTIHRCSHQNF